MNRRPPGGVRVQAEPTLAPAAAFRRYTAKYGRRPPMPNGVRMAAAIGRKHCAGRQGAIDGETILDALRRPPEHDDAGDAIQWMFGSLTIPEVNILTVRCGVAYEDLAAHLREHYRPRPALVRYLNQYTLPPDAMASDDAGAAKGH